MSAVAIGVGYGSLVPLFQTMVIQIATPERRGAATATFLLALDGGISAGSFILGSLVADIGYGNLYLSISAVMFLSLYVYYRIYSANHKKFNSLRSVRRGEDTTGAVSTEPVAKDNHE